MTTPPCSVLLRIYCKGIGALYAYTGLTQPDTLTYQVAHADAVGVTAMYALAILAGLGMLDVLVNDILAERFVLKPSLHYRHLVSMGMAICFGMQMWLCVKNGVAMSMVPFYAIYVLLIPAAAFSDIRTRFKLKVCP